MSKNYFEHEIQVKYVDNLLSKSTDWNWFIDYLEENFEVDFTIANSTDFFNVFSEIKDVFVHLNKIHEIVDDIKINQDWLKDIDMVSRYYVGILEYNKLSFNNDFIQLLVLYVFSAKIINEKSELKYLIYTDIFNSYNIFEIIDMTDFSYESDIIFQLIDSLKIDFSKEKGIFNDNLNTIHHSCGKVSEQLLAVCSNPDAFSFRNSFDMSGVLAWEEKYLLRFLSAEYSDGKFIPEIQFTDGSTLPDFNVYTPDIVAKIKQYYKNTDVEFLVETIDYGLRKSIPSQETINKHFQLLQSNIDNYSDEKGFIYLKCSSLEFVLSFFSDVNINTDDKKSVFNIAISKIDNIEYFSYLKKRNAPIGKNIIKILKEYVLNEASEIDNINEIRAFHSYINNADIVSVVDKNIFYKVSDKFEEVIENVIEKDSVLIASIFMDYLLFLIKIKNNRNIISSEISSEIIFIRSLWQDIYFKICSKAVRCFNAPFDITKDAIEQHNLNIIDKPFLCACNCMLLKDERLIKCMERTADNPLLILVDNIIICEDFPYRSKMIIDKDHRVDLLLMQVLEKLHNDNRYKFRNSFSIEKHMSGLYQSIKEQFQVYFSLFNETERLYNIVIKENPKYKLIEYSKELSLAHLTQLFPIVENKIREVGELFGIASICENKDKYYKLKEPSSVLTKIIQLLYDEIGKISYVSDYIFIHFALFAENGLGIRNECIHGNGYNTEEKDIVFAIKVTLFCLHLLEYRMQLIRGNVV